MDDTVRGGGVAGVTEAIGASAVLAAVKSTIVMGDAAVVAFAE